METHTIFLYRYHTHLHGTSSMLTWSGMFGLTLNGEETVAQARSEPREKTTLTKDLVDIADAEGLEFDDEDVNFVVIYDTMWSIDPNVTDGTEVVLSDWVTAVRVSLASMLYAPLKPGRSLPLTCHFLILLLDVSGKRAAPTIFCEQRVPTID
jgi:hypothetical protein